ncbi:hypothetical protein Tco_1182223 [Tanacetum coccineum]
MRPFGCHVTILNTLDPLGKFDGKAEEGFLVAYSVNSKAFRVFNSQTKKVEENLHVNFLENKPNIAGQGPNWLFDIDSLTNSMNYQPVTTGESNKKKCRSTKANGDTEKEAFRATDAVRENEFEAEHRSFFKGRLLKPAGDSQLHWGGTSTIVSPIPTTRIHSIHPKDQIIGDPKSAVQTRGMSKKNSGEHAMISYIQKQKRTNHKDFQNCLFACFLSQICNGKNDDVGGVAIEVMVLVHGEDGGDEILIVWMWVWRGDMRVTMGVDGICGGVGVQWCWH